MCTPPGGYYGGPGIPGGVPSDDASGEIDSDGGVGAPGPGDDDVSDGDDVAEEPASGENDDEDEDDAPGSQNNAVEDDARSGDEGSCSLTAPASSSAAGLWLMGLLGLGLLRRRRN
jgi:MYXO-CTERM domain-containing protein